MKFTCKTSSTWPPPHFVYTQKKCKITHQMKTTNFCANQLNKLLGRYLLLMECLSHLPMKSHILVHYIICGRQRFSFFFRLSFHFVIMGPICIGLFPYFMFDCLLSFVLWVVFHSCSHLLCTFDGWVFILDFYI